MKTIFKLTLADLKAMKPRPEVLAFAKSCGGNLQKFWDTCPNGDWLLWLLRKTGNLPELEARAIALAYARKVLPVFEKINPFDNRPRRCLKAVELFLKHPTLKNERAMRKAAHETHATYTASAAAAAAYYAACYPSGSASADYAVRFATDAADVITTDHSFCSTSSLDARKIFAQWGANQIRSIIKLPAPKAKKPNPRPKP